MYIQISQKGFFNFFYLRAFLVEILDHQAEFGLAGD